MTPGYTGRTATLEIGRNKSMLIRSSVLKPVSPLPAKSWLAAMRLHVGRRDRLRSFPKADLPGDHAGGRNCARSGRLAELQARTGNEVFRKSIAMDSSAEP